MPFPTAKSERDTARKRKAVRLRSSHADHPAPWRTLTITTTTVALQIHPFSLIDELNNRLSCGQPHRVADGCPHHQPDELANRQSHGQPEEIARLRTRLRGAANPTAVPTGHPTAKLTANSTANRTADAADRQPHRKLEPRR